MRHRSRAYVPLLLATAAASTWIPVTHAADPSLTATPAGGVVRIVLAADQPAGSITAYVRGGDQPASGVLEIDQLTSSGSLPPTGTITITARGGEELEAVRVPMAPAMLPVTIAVADLTTPGMFTANVVLRAETGAGSLGTVTVVKEPAIGFFVVGADTTGLSLKTDKPTFSTVLQIDSISVAEQIVNVSIAPITGPAPAKACISPIDEPETKPSCIEATAVDSDASAPSPEPCHCERLAIDGVTIPSRGSARIEIGASVPVEGDYSSVISIVWASGRLNVAVKLTRSIAAAPFAVPSPATLHLERFGDTSRTVPIIIDPNSLRPFDAPSIEFLVPLARQEGEALTANAIKTSIAAPTTMPIGAAPRTYTLTVSDPAAQGTYVGTLKVAAPNHAAVNVPVKVVVRDSWRTAVLTILAGMVLGWFIRRYLTHWRPRIARDGTIRQRRAEVAVLATTYAREPEVLLALASILQNLARCEEANDTGSLTPADLEDRLKVIGTQINRIEDWVRILPDIRLLRSIAADAEPELRTRIRDFETALTSEEKFDTVNAALSRFHAVDVEVDAALEKVLQRRVDDAAALADDVQTWAPDDAGKVTLVRGKLASARVALADRATRGTAASDVRDAQASLLDVMVDGLRVLIAKPPEFLNNPLDQGPLSDLGDRAAAAVAGTSIDPNQAIATVAVIRRAFYVTALEALKRLPAKSDKLTAAQGTLAAALERGDMKAAATAYTSVVELAPHPEGVRLDEAPTPDPLQIDVAAVPNPAVTARRRVPGPAVILRTLDAVTWLLLLLAATAVALATLWAPNPIWGTVPDYLTALLIGLGVKIAATDAAATTIDTLWRGSMKPLEA